jgi:hypothetical protein
MRNSEEFQQKAAGALFRAWTAVLQANGNFSQHAKLGMAGYACDLSAEGKRSTNGFVLYLPTLLA